MKENRFSFLLLTGVTGRRALLGISAILAAMTLAGCTDSDDNPVAESTNPIEEVEYLAPEDPLGDFMANFFTTDEEGNTVQVGGESLDEADPTVLSIGVASLEEAELMFRTFVTDTIHLESYVEGNITYSPVSRNGEQQGEIYFTAGGDGCIARVTFSDDIPQENVSEIRFIDEKLWPNNATESPFVAGTEYVMLRAYRSKTDKWFKFLMETREAVAAGIHPKTATSVPMLCVHAGGQGKSAIFLRYKFVMDNEYDYDYVTYTSKFPYANTEDPKQLGYGMWVNGLYGWTDNWSIFRLANLEERFTEDKDLGLPTANQFEQIHAYLEELGGLQTVLKSYEGTARDWHDLQYFQKFWTAGYKYEPNWALTGYVEKQRAYDLINGTNLGYLECPFELALASQYIFMPTMAFHLMDRYHALRKRDDYQRDDESEYDIIQNIKPSTAKGVMSVRSTTGIMFGYYIFL